MLSATAILFLVGLPVAGSGAAVLVALGALRSSGPVPAPSPGPARPQVLILAMLPATLAIFALLLYLLSSAQDREGAPAAMLDAAALAYGVPALLSGLALTVFTAGACPPLYRARSCARGFSPPRRCRIPRPSLPCYFPS